MIELDDDFEGFVFTCMRCNHPLPDDNEYCKACGHQNTDTFGYYDRSILLADEAEALHFRCSHIDETLKAEREKNTLLAETLVELETEITYLLNRLDEDKATIQ